MRRFATIALSLCLLLGLTGAHYLLAQDEPKKDDTPKAETSKTEASTPEPSKDKEKDAATKPDASASAEPVLAPIPPEVEAKLEAARRAVAEAIVAAQDAGLVKTTIDPPPILDILVTGRANDESTVKRTGVSPEVLGAWFTGYGTAKDIVPQKDVRITNPSAGLKEFYDQRANFLKRHIAAVRKAQEDTKKEATPAKEETKAETPKAETPKVEAPKAEAPKAEAPKAETPKAEAEPKKDEAKSEEVKKDKPQEDAPKDDAKKDDKSGGEDKSKDDTPK